MGRRRSGQKRTWTEDLDRKPGQEAILTEGELQKEGQLPLPLYLNSEIRLQLSPRNVSGRYLDICSLEKTNAYNGK